MQLNMRSRLGLLAMPVLAAMLASCGPTPQLRVHDAVIKLNPVDSNPSAMYFTVLGGPKEIYLLSVSSTSVIRTEMHESAIDPKTGAMTMNKLDRVKVPVDGKVKFKRGGKHVMVWGVNMVGRRLGEVEAQFLFSNNERILVKARVEEMDGSEPDEKTGKTSAPAKPEAPKGDHGEHSGH
ncbi:MAG: copper chaperone PCu(A)C [Sphingobium sp.]|nr:MAG: copper chaperone PCu(A)C [Sphingobium sp.]